MERPADETANNSEFLQRGLFVVVREETRTGIRDGFNVEEKESRKGLDWQGREGGSFEAVDESLLRMTIPLLSSGTTSGEKPAFVSRSWMLVGKYQRSL